MPMRATRDGNTLCICNQCECEMKTPEKVHEKATTFAVEKRGWSYIGEDILLCSICNSPAMWDKWEAFMETRHKKPSRPLGEGIGSKPVEPGKRRPPRPSFRGVTKR